MHSFMRYKRQTIVIIVMIAFVAFIQCSKSFKVANDEPVTIAGRQSGAEKDKSLVAQGKEIFRFDDFGDKDFWSGLLHLDKAIAGSANGGFGPGVSPLAALAVGLKVDVDALPAALRSGIISGAVDLNNPATTIALLKLNAVVG